MLLIVSLTACPKSGISFDRVGRSKAAATALITILDLSQKPGTGELVLSWTATNDSLKWQNLEYEIYTDGCGVGKIQKSGIVEFKAGDTALTDFKVEILYHARMRALNGSTTSTWTECKSGLMTLPEVELTTTDLKASSVQIVTNKGQFSSTEKFRFEVLDGDTILSSTTESFTHFKSVLVSGLSSGNDYILKFRIISLETTKVLFEKTVSVHTLNAWTTVISAEYTRAEYSALGLTSKSNHPMSAWEPYFTAGEDNSKYMFGGVTTTKEGVTSDSNLLWNLNKEGIWTPLTGVLGYVANLDASEAVWGTIGVPSKDNSPPGLHSGFTGSCSDSQGNFWLYGGYNYGWNENNALWRYNPSSGWARMYGSVTSYNSPAIVQPSYGVKGVESSGVHPGGRTSAVLACGKDGFVYLFGGQQGVCTNSATCVYNSTFRFNPATLNWAWISGSQSLNPAGIHGTKGVTSVTNEPGGRVTAGICTDQDGIIWMYGGLGMDKNGTSLAALSDLWKFDGTSWTWVAGSDERNEIPIWSDLGSESLNATPGARRTKLFCAKDGSLVLSGGNAFDGAYQTLHAGLPNGFQDIWRFNTKTSRWKWIYGPGSTERQLPASYGTVGVPDTSNIPPAGMYASWLDSDGVLWLQGTGGNSVLMRWK